jgi:hypothetical protein
MIPNTHPGVAGVEIEGASSTPESRRLNQSRPSDAISSSVLNSTERPHESSAGMLGALSSSFVKDQPHSLFESSAGKGLSMSGRGNVSSSDGETTSVQQPAPSTSERVLTTTPTRLEVGVPGGAHGWLKIRAELAGDGAVHASMSTTSSAGVEMLRRELPALSTFLHQEQVPVGSLVVHATVEAQDASKMARGDGSNHMGGQQQGDGQPDRGQRGATSSNDWIETSRADGIHDGSDSWFLQLASVGSGGWLSVRA